MSMWRFRKRWILSSFLLIASASLLLSQYAAFNNPTANFFLLLTRGWELAIGASIAFYFLFRKQLIFSLLRHKPIDELFSWLGIALIGYAVFVFNENTPFPSFYALVPTIGTALIIIFSSKDTLVGKLLGSKIPVSIGLISYSAYLWHKPLFAFARDMSLQKPTPLFFAVLSIASLLLAFVSWKYVESPFRKMGIFSRKQVFSFTAFGSVIFVTFGSIGYLTDGYIERFDYNFIKSIDSAKKLDFDKKLCKKTAHPELVGDHCVLVDNENKFAFLYGDSHAEALANAAKNAFAKTDLGLLFAFSDGCPPIKGVDRIDGKYKHKCFEYTKRVYNYIENNPHIKYVILSGRWAIWIEGTRFDNKEGGVEYGSKVQLEWLKIKNFFLTINT